MKWLIIVVLVGCGADLNEYGSSEEPSNTPAAKAPESTETDTTTDTAEEETQAACLTAFGPIHTVIVDSCEQCHAEDQNVPIHYSTDIQENLAALNSFINGDPENLNTKIGPDSDHAGGDQSAVLTPDMVQDYYEACK